ncbi:serine hydrolase [Pseudoflavitalea sp. G-6-1-2]|uniref:serine hydrolase domain-containing protein n=1 Tax=Pseudoflavitalea sp. G-6-1-2 TaxID=2728841 RepID=UPI00146CB1DF|nr:serine hydrolase [Pseudoflavitalea sp. G-6-1-2]NML21360.1 serine hydrolase [Pseudoflavitalea sp. G-6-1-2]
MRKGWQLSILTLALFFSCKKEGSDNKNPDPVNDTMYFPPAGSSDWHTVSPAALNWDQAGFSALYSYLESKGTKAFIVLKNGRIAAEKYFGDFTVNSDWYWASAGKTITGLLVGIAQEEALLKLSDQTSKYLGKGWTSLPAAKEDLITIRHQLTMTTGLDDDVKPDNDCTTPACLVYKSDAGARWAYHNAPYTLLGKVIEKASGKTYQNYFQQAIRDKIGMRGLWVQTGYNNIYGSDARSMARFGLLLLNKGSWNNTDILKDKNYFNTQISSSQNMNPSYGYLTWLNGKSQYMLPTLQFQFAGSLVPNAPADMYAALGKNDQKIYVVPGLQLVVIRMGEAAGESKLAASSFDNELWGKLKTILRY